MVTLVLVAGAAPTPVVAVPAPPHWDHVGYDAENSGFNPHETVITPATVKRLTKKWSVTLRTDEVCSSLGGTPIVADGRVFVGDQKGISAYAAGDGTELWSHDWESSAGGSPRMTAADGVLVVGYNDCESFSDPNSVLIGLDVRTGVKRWTAPEAPMIDEIIVDKGVVLTSGSDIYQDSGTVVARLADGGEAWRNDHQITGETSANGIIMQYGGSGTTALDITTGATRWSLTRSFDSGNASPAGDVFYGSSDEGKHLEAVAVSDGTLRWTVPGPATVLAVDGARVYRSEEESIVALDARTGQTSWRRALPSVYSYQTVVAGGVVYVAGLALDAADGTVITGTPPLDGSLVVTGGVLYQSSGGSLTAYTVNGS